MDESLLLPCPFCGSVPRVLDDAGWGDDQGDNPRWYWVQCEGPSCGGAITAEKSSGQAIEKWNRRDALSIPRQDALRYWLDNNTTFYDVRGEVPIDDVPPNVPALATVSKRIWYHATDDQTSYPFSALADAAIAAQPAKKPDAEGSTEASATDKPGAANLQRDNK